MICPQCAETRTDIARSMDLVRQMRVAFEQETRTIIADRNAYAAALEVVDLLLSGLEVDAFRADALAHVVATARKEIRKAQGHRDLR